MSLPDSPTVVITGAAGGFGRAFALEVAARRARLVLSDVNLPGCEETARLALGAGAASARALRCDVTKLADLEALSRAVEGTVDLVVLNAGVGASGRIGEMPIDDWRWTIEVDLWGVIHGCHVFVPRLRAQGHGHVLNVASAAGLLAMPQTAAYNVAKAGVVALTETLAAELDGTRIGVTALCPTHFQTDIVANGRVTAETRSAAARLIDSGPPASAIAARALADVERGELYSVPMANGRWGWRIKRVLPRVAPKLLARWTAWQMRA